jgi:hypothetical protein
MELINEFWPGVLEFASDKEETRYLRILGKINNSKFNIHHQNCLK